MKVIIDNINVETGVVSTKKFDIEYETEVVVSSERAVILNNNCRVTVTGMIIGSL